MKTGKFTEATTFVPMKTENLKAFKETKYQIFNTEQEIATLKIDEEGDFSLDIMHANKSQFLEILELCKNILGE